MRIEHCTEFDNSALKEARSAIIPAVELSDYPIMVHVERLHGRHWPIDSALRMVLGVDDGVGRGWQR